MGGHSLTIELNFLLNDTILYKGADSKLGVKIALRDGLDGHDYVDVTHLSRLGGYIQTDEHRNLAYNSLYLGNHVCWNVGVGPAASFVKTITRLAVEEFSEMCTFDHVIKVQLMKPPEETEIHASYVMSSWEQVTAAVAEELGQEYYGDKQAHEERCYFSWGSMERYETRPFVDGLQINVTLRNKKYLLVVENLYEPMWTDDLLYRTGLPDPRSPLSSYSVWLISTMSQQVCDRSKLERERVWGPFHDDYIMVLILSSLHQSAKDISKAVGLEDDDDNEEKHWHRAALRCFHYALLLLFPCEQDNTSHYVITSHELICHWAAQGFLVNFSCKPRAVQANIHAKDIKGHHADDIYQVGNAILQAFSEYSLLKLPFSPAAEANEATEIAAHFLIYHDLVASHLSEYEIFHEEEVVPKNKRWIRMVYKQGMENQGWHLSTKLLSKEEPNDPTTLILRQFLDTSSLLNLIDNILPKLPCLRVLDLSYTQLESLPPSIWNLSNLILLSLRGCCGLKSLSTVSNSGSAQPENDKHQMMNNLLYLDLTLLNINIFPNDFFQGMTKLEELMLAGCSSLVELPCSMCALSGLLSLEVTGTKLTSLPSSMFARMQKLQSLKLVDNKLLVSIPRSISEACALRELHILGCDELKEVDVFGGAGLKIVILSGSVQLWNLPKSLMEEEPRGCLEELHIEGWHSSMVQKIKLDGHPTLKSFSLISAPHIRRLSLRGCSKLECVDLRDLGTLEDLDLSATALKEIPTNIPNLPMLRRFLLMGFPAQSRFPWHKLQRFPDVFCLDHCAQGHGNRHDDQVARVCVKDSRLFYSFNGNTKELVQRGEFLQSFYVQITPPTVNIRRLEDEEDMLANRLREIAHKRSPYGDVYHHYIAVKFSAVSMEAPPIRQTARHVQISTIDCYPHGLKYLLEVAKSVYVTNDSFVKRLTDLSNLDELEECKLHFCHRMKHVFKTTSYVGRSKYMGFSSLNHLHLEYCPRLKSIMPRDCALPSLTTLNILFCYNLNTIFHIDRDKRAISDEFPRLQRMRLQELPLLKHLYDGDDNGDDIIISAPAWKELHVRGCWSLQHLPRLRQEHHRSQAVEVSGERAWWEKLIWDDDSSPTHSGCYKHKPPLLFASFDEHATVMTYLR